MKDMHNLYAKLRKKDDAIKNHVTIHEQVPIPPPPPLALPPPPPPPPMSQVPLLPLPIAPPVTSASAAPLTSVVATVATTEAAAPLPTTVAAAHHHPHAYPPVATTPRVEHVLQQFVDADVENHVSILSADDGSNEAICLASKAMKEHYQVFPELCLLDIANCTHDSAEMDGNQLYGFMSMDALGNSKPIFLAQIIHPVTTRLLHRICQDFKRTHPRWTDLKLIVMDTLLPMVVDVFREEFPTMRVLLCQFHVIKYFSQIVSQPEFDIPSIETQEHVSELLKELVFAHSERYYQDVKAHVLELLDNRRDHPLMVHLVHHWGPYRRLWVSYWRLRSLEFSSFFTKGFEAFWLPLKNIFERSGQVGGTALAAAATMGVVLPTMAGNPSVTHGMGVSVLAAASPCGSPTLGPIDPTHSIAKCMSEVITMMKFIEEEWTSKMLMLEMTKPVTEFSAGSVLHFLVNCMSSFGVGLVSTQLVTANTGVGGSVSIVKGRAAVMRMTHTGLDTVDEYGNVISPDQPLVEDPLAAEGTVVYVDKAKKQKHVMRRDCSGCDCEFYEVYQLPCQHLIWYEISYLHHKQLSMSAVGQRWFLRTFQIPKLTSHKESNEVRIRCSDYLGIAGLSDTNILCNRSSTILFEAKRE
jgi:hypothetical protein